MQMRHQTARWETNTFFKHSDTKPKSIAFHLQYLLLPCVSPIHLFHCEKAEKYEGFQRPSLDQNCILCENTTTKRAILRHTQQWEVEHSIKDTFYVCHVYQHGEVTDKWELFMLRVELTHSTLCNGMLTATWRFRLNPEINMDLTEREKNSGYKHNNKVSHGIFNVTFRMLQHKNLIIRNVKLNIPCETLLLCL